MLKSEVLSTHERILQKTLQNCSKRNIHVRATNIQTSLQQIRERANGKKICVECYSMLKYIILSQIEKKTYPSVDFLLQNQKELKSIIDLVNCIIFGITQMYGDSEDFILLFPQEDHFRVNKHYEGPLKILMNQLLTAQFKQERKKQQCSFEGEESIIYELAKILFLNIGANVRNPFTIEQEISFFGQLSEQFQSPKVLIKLIVPWLNNSLFYEDPCAVQLSYLASQGFICFSWSSCCLNYIPIGIYIIGFKVENLVALTKQSTKLRKLRDDGIQHSIQRKLEYQERILKDLQKTIKQSENILYIFDAFMERIQKQGFSGTYFRTDQLFLTSLLPFSNELDLSQRNLTEIRNGRYSMAGWMNTKIFIQYLMVELHPIIVQVSCYKYELRCSKVYENKFKVLFEQDISYASLQQQHKVIKNFSQKYLFMHRSFQGLINKYIPNNLQQIHRFFKSPIKDLQDDQTKKRINNSTNQTEGNKQIEQQTKRLVSRSLFNNNIKAKNPQTKIMNEKNSHIKEDGKKNETVEADSDIEQQGAKGL